MPRLPPHPSLPTNTFTSSPARPPWNTNHNLVVTHPLLSLLESCASLPHLLQIHARLAVSGLASHRFPASRILAFCALSSPAHLRHAAAVLAHTPNPNAYMHNTMMRGYINSHLPSSALALFRRIVQESLHADARTLVFALKASEGSLGGAAIHCLACKWGFLDRSVLVGNALMHFYAQNGILPAARNVFDEMLARDVVSWTTSIDGYAQNGCPDQAWRVYCRMVLEGVRPNEVTLVAVLSAVGQMGMLRLGKMVHDYVLTGRVNVSVNLHNALLDMFGKCGCVGSAREVFDGMEVKDVYSWTSMVNAHAKCGELELAMQLFEVMPKRNVVSWSSMIAAYSQANRHREAVRLFREMIAANVEPINATLVSVLSACAQLGYLDLGRWIYNNYIVGNKIRLSVNLTNAFIDMYAKCGDVGAASRLFSEMVERDIVTWNSMIMAHAVHGHFEKALDLFGELKGTGVMPDEITFVAVLSACSHGGLVSEGRCHFEEMKVVYGIEPTAEHYACMIDLLGKVGLLEEAFDVTRTMPMEPDEAGWGALLNACRMHGNVEIGKYAADKLLGLDPGDSGIYMLMSQIYASKNKWDDVKMVRKMMRDRGVKKNPGYSSIEVNGKFHEFLVVDTSHVCSEDMYAVLENIYLHLKWEGYVPVT